MIALLKNMELLSHLLGFDLFRKNAVATPTPAARKPRGQGPAKFHLIYFTCGKHYEFLRMSLQSLANRRIRHIGSVSVYVDPLDPLSPKQKRALKEIGVPLELKSTAYRMSWGGSDVILNELIAFSEISSKAAPSDWLVKVDSDILFTSEKIFSLVRRSRAAMLGQRVNQNKEYFQYTQGGCYFLRAMEVTRLFRTSMTWNMLKICSSWKKRLRDCPEDAVICGLLKGGGGQVEFRNFIVEVAAIVKHGQARIQLGDSSAVHFAGPAKKLMPAVMEILGRGGRARKAA